MKYLFFIAAIVSCLSSANASSIRHKKEKWYEDRPSSRHHHNGKKVAASVAGAVAKGVSKDAIENIKKSRDKNYSSSSN